MKKEEIKMKSKFQMMVLALSIIATTSYAQEVSPYMGGEVNLTEAPNGAVLREEVLTTSAKIVYTEPTTEKLTDGVWCIGGYSLANTTVIEADDNQGNNTVQQLSAHRRPGCCDHGKAGGGKTHCFSAGQ